MAMHKLADGPYTMTVALVEACEGNFGPQFRFEGDDEIGVFVSEAATFQQLERMDLTVETVVGKTIHMEQVKKNGKTFTNIDLAGARGTSPIAAPAAAPARVAARAVAAPAPRMTVDEVAALYLECVNAAFMTFGSRCEEAGVPPTADSLQAATATIFIKVSR